MLSTQQLLDELKEIFGKRWPITLMRVVGTIGSSVRVSKDEIEDGDRFWNTNHDYLHEQNAKFIRYFYEKYKQRHAKTKTTRTAK